MRHVTPHVELRQPGLNKGEASWADSVQRNEARRKDAHRFVFGNQDFFDEAREAAQPGRHTWIETDMLDIDRVARDDQASRPDM
jgi:hypothetical protein